MTYIYGTVRLIVVSGVLRKNARAKPIWTQPAQDGSWFVLLDFLRFLYCFGYWPFGCLLEFRFEELCGGAATCRHLEVI